MDNGLKKLKSKISDFINEAKKNWNIGIDGNEVEFVDETGFDAQIEFLKGRIDDLRATLQEPISFNFTDSEILELSVEEERLTNQLVNLIEKQKKLNGEVDDYNKKIKQGQSNLNNINDSMTGLIKKVGKWALAVFGVRSAYSALRTAMSTLTQYDDQLAYDISYIKYVLASLLQPVIKTIVSLVYKLMAYVAYLAKAWFNIDLFANSSVKAFNKANGAAKQLNKTLSGTDFDDLNILQDNSSDSSSSITTPSISFEDVEIPEWLTKFKDFCQPIIDFFKDIIDKYGPVAGGIMTVVGALAGFWIIKSIITFIKNLGKAITGISADFTGFFNSLGKAAEAIAVLGGIALVIDSITNLIDTFSESGMSLGQVAGLLGIVLGEVAAAFIVLLGAMTLLQPSWQSIAAAAVIFAGLALVLESVSHLIDTFANSGLSLNEVIGLMSTILLTIIGLMGSIVLLGPAMTAGLGPFLAVVAGISAILLVMAATLPTILDAVGNFIDKTAPSLSLILETIGGLIVDIIDALGTDLPPIIKSVGDLFTSIFNGVSTVINSVGNTLVKILNSIGNLVNTVLGSLLNFINNLGPATENFVSHVISAVTKLINFMISGIEYLVNTLVVNGVNSIINGINSIGKYVGFTIPNVPKFTIARFTPTYMAGGGIIDIPKRGVPLASNVVGGEAGAEGVLPLERPETMERLGKEIAKWITINIDLTGKIDKRVLFREFMKYYNEQTFSRNGG